MEAARASAPTRIDLAGGTLDIWPLYLLVPGSVTVNLALDLPARAAVTPREDGRVVLHSDDTGDTVDAADLSELAVPQRLPLLRQVALTLRPTGGFALTTRSAVPAGSGLGGSSSMAVAVIRALSDAMGERLRRREIIALARDIEAAVIRTATGTQDHYAAAYGGLSAIHLRPGRPERERIPRDLASLSGSLLLAVVGQSRPSAVKNWEMVRAALDGDAEVLRGFADIAAAARDMRDALLGGDIEAAAAAMAREYEVRRALVPGIETPEMRRVFDAARDAGALSGKVCGAGGGGGMVFFVPPEKKASIKRAVAAAGGSPLYFAPDDHGLAG